MGGLIQQYLTFYNTSKIMLYNPVDNITIIIPAPYNQISIIPCQFSIPTYYPLVTYLKKTNNTFPLNETLLYFTNYGKNIIVQTILTIYNCPAVTVHREPPPQILLHSYNKITLSSVTVYINGNLIPSVSSILFFNSAVVFNLTNNNYITYNGNLTSGKIVSGIILHNTTPYYNYYNIKGVEQPMISNGNVIINDKYYSIPIGGYVVGVIGDHVVLYKNGEIYVINVKAISGENPILYISQPEIESLIIAGIAVLALLLIIIKKTK